MTRERIPLPFTVRFSDEHDENAVSCESLRLAPRRSACLPGACPLQVDGFLRDAAHLKRC